MNKKIVLTAAALCFVIIAVGAFLLLAPKNTTPSTNTNQTNMTANESSGPGIKDLFSSGKNQQCTFSDELGNQGTFYITNGKMRGDFSSLVANQTVKSHLILDAKTAYIWNDDNTGKGIKTEFDINAASSEPTNGLPTGVDINKNYNYNCSTWTVVSTTFDLPTGVEFLDVSSLLVPKEETPVTQDPESPQNCSICDQAPESSKAQCLQALGCN